MSMRTSRENRASHRLEPCWASCYSHGWEVDYPGLVGGLVGDDVAGDVGGLVGGPLMTSKPPAGRDWLEPDLRARDRLRRFARRDVRCKFDRAP